MDEKCFNAYVVDLVFCLRSAEIFHDDGEMICGISLARSYGAFRALQSSSSSHRIGAYDAMRSSMARA
jgi:hypothetical protein